MLFQVLNVNHKVNLEFLLLNYILGNVFININQLLIITIGLWTNRIRRI